MSRRKQTNPRAIKRDGKFRDRSPIGNRLFFAVSQDEDDNAIPTAKSKSLDRPRHRGGVKESLFIFVELATESIRSDSIDSSVTTEEEPKRSPIKCDSCQESFLTSEQFNQHRLYQCSCLPGQSAVIKHEMNLLLLMQTQCNSFLCPFFRR